jgi:hypothetical protein
MCADGFVNAPNTPTRNSNSASSFFTADVHNSYYAHGGFYFLNDDSEGDYTIICPIPDSHGAVGAVAIYMKDVKQNAPYANGHTTGVFTDPSLGIGSTSASLCCDNAFCEDSISSAGGGQTIIGNYGPWGTGSAYAGYSTKAGTGSTVTFTWNQSGTDPWLQIAACFEEDVAASAITHLDLDRGFNRGMPSGLHRGMA